MWSPHVLRVLDPAGVELGGQRYFEQCKRLLSLSLPMATLGRAQARESHTTNVGSRCESDSPGAQIEAWPGRGPTAMNK
jgi:hypothetical protein